MLDSLKSLIGFQEPKGKNPDGSFFVFVNRDSGPGMTEMSRIPVTETSGFELANDVLGSLEPNSRKYPIEVIKSQVKTDSGFPAVFIEELGIVTIQPLGLFDKPIISFPTESGIRYIAHPDIRYKTRRV